MMTNTKGPISNFIEKYYLHFNAASVVDAAKAYEVQLNQGSKMLVSLAGAMSTAELGKIFAEMIRKDKVQIISCTGANLEEDIMNLVAHSHYKRLPNYRDLTPSDEWELLLKGLNRVTDTCIPEEEAFRKIGDVVMDYANHWINVINTGLSPEVQATLADTDLTERDAGVRYNLFSPSIDPVWGRVDAMIGPEGSELIRSNLQLL